MPRGIRFRLENKTGEAEPRATTPGNSKRATTTCPEPCRSSSHSAGVAAILGAAAASAAITAIAAVITTRVAISGMVAAGKSAGIKVVRGVAINCQPYGGLFQERVDAAAGHLRGRFGVALELFRGRFGAVSRSGALRHATWRQTPLESSKTCLCSPSCTQKFKMPQVQNSELQTAGCKHATLKTLNMPTWKIPRRQNATAQMQTCTVDRCKHADTQTYGTPTCKQLKRITPAFKTCQHANASKQHRNAECQMQACTHLCINNLYYWYGFRIVAIY